MARPDPTGRLLNIFISGFASLSHYLAQIHDACGQVETQRRFWSADPSSTAGAGYLTPRHPPPPRVAWSFLTALRYLFCLFLCCHKVIKRNPETSDWNHTKTSPIRWDPVTHGQFCCVISRMVCRHVMDSPLLSGKLWNLLTNAGQVEALRHKTAGDWQVSLCIRIDPCFDSWTFQ